MGEAAGGKSSHKTVAASLHFIVFI